MISFVLTMDMATIFYCFMALSITIIFFKVVKQKNRPGPLALPILGHLYLMTKEPIHRTLENLANRYSPVLFLRFGCLPFLVVTSPSAVEQCFSKNDVIFANRPRFLAPKYLGYNFTTLGFSPYGDRWRNLRRVTMIQIFSNSRIQTFSSTRDVETRSMINELYKTINGSTGKVNLNNILFQLTFDVTTRIVAGIRCERVEEIFSPLMLMGMCDYLPVLRWVGYKRIEKNLIELQKVRDKFLQDLIDNHRKASVNAKSNGEERKSIISSLLDLQEYEPESYTDEVIKGTILTMFTAGTDTTARTMEWAMSLLLNYPQILQKAKEEINNIIKQDHLLDDADVSKLPYLHCIIKETLRLYPVAPLLIPHYSSQDCNISGYKVDRGTILLVNAWAIHRSKDYWDEPLKFKPERFEGAEMGHEEYKYIPFGVGRRACPGANMAMRIIGLGLGRLIQCFDWERVGDEMVDMSEDIGLTLIKVQPLEALCTPRSDMKNLFSQL